MNDSPAPSVSWARERPRCAVHGKCRARHPESVPLGDHPDAVGHFARNACRLVVGTGAFRMPTDLGGLVSSVIGSDSEADPVVGCCVRDHRFSDSRYWVDSGAVTAALGIRPDTGHDQRTCVTWCSGPMGDDVGSDGLGRLPCDYRCRVAAGANFRSVDPWWWGCGDGNGGHIRPASSRQLPGSHRRGHGRADGSSYLASSRYVSRTGCTSVDVRSLGCGVRCPGRAGGVVRC